MFEPLKSCPFCGNDKYAADEPSDNGRDFIECDVCLVRGPSKPTMQEAAEAWNNIVSQTERTWCV